MPKLNKNAWAFIEMVLPWVMLLFLGYYTLAMFVIMPYPGVFIDQRKTVTVVYGPDQGENSFLQGDVIEQIGPVTYLDITIQEINSRLNSQWFTPYIFWLAGTVSLLFLRPRGLLRFLMALFCYITATWLGASPCQDTIL